MIDEHLEILMEQVKARKKWLLYLQEETDITHLLKLKNDLEKENRELATMRYSYCARNLIKKNNEELQIINDKLKKLKGVA